MTASVDDDLYLDNDELWELIPKRVAQTDPPVPMAHIALELGVPVDALCKWIMQYREPRHKTRYQTPDKPALAITSSAMHPHWSQSQRSQRFANWRKATAAAHEARKL